MDGIPTPPQDVAETTPLLPPSPDERFSNKRKYSILLIVAFVSFTAFSAANCFIPTMREVALDLGTSTDVVAASIGVYFFCNAFGSLLGSRYAEFYGRRYIYIISLPIFIIASFLVSLSQRVWHLMVLRGLQSFGVSSFASVGSGTVADVFEVERRGFALGLYSGSIVMAPAFAPLFGGAIAQQTSWRFLQVCLGVVGILCLVVAYLFLPETSQPGSRGIDRIDQTVKKPRLAWRVLGGWVVLFNPFSPLLVFRQRNIAIICVFMSITLLSETAMVIQLPNLLEQKYNITNEALIGLICMIPGIGNLLGAPLAGYLSDNTVLKYRTLRGKIIDVDRLRTCWAGALVLVPVSLVGYGFFFHFGEGESLWTKVGICTALVLNGVGVEICFGPGLAYIADNIKTNRIEGLAANSAMRVLTLSAVSTFILPSSEAIGVVWTSCIMAAATFGASGLLYSLIRSGVVDQLNR